MGFERRNFAMASPIFGSKGLPFFTVSVAFVLVTDGRDFSRASPVFGSMGLLVWSSDIVDDFFSGVYVS